MLRNEAMVLPRNAVMMQKNEMQYVEGGKIPSRGMKRTAVESFKRNKEGFETYTGWIMPILTRKIR